MILLISVFVVILSAWLLQRYTGHSLLSGFLRQVTGIPLRIKSVGWLRLYGVEVDFGEKAFLQIHSVTFTFFPSHFSKPLLLSVHDVRVESSASLSFLISKSSNSSSSNTNSLSSGLKSLIQYIAVHVNSVQLVVLEAIPTCLIHATLDDIRLEAFRGRRSWQAEASCSLGHAKVLQRSGISGTPPCLAEVSLGFSMSLDSSSNSTFSTQLTLQDPLVSISDRILEIGMGSGVGDEKRGRLPSQASPAASPPNSPLLWLNGQLLLSAFTLRYSARFDSAVRTVSLSGGRCEVAKEGEQLQVSIAEVNLSEQAKQSLFRCASVAAAAQLAPERVLEVLVDGTRVVLPLEDALCWQTHLRSLSRFFSPSAPPRPGPPLPSFPPLLPDISLKVSGVSCRLIAVNGCEWNASGDFLHLSVLNSAFKAELDCLSLRVVTHEKKSESIGVSSFSLHRWGETLFVGAAIIEWWRDPDCSSRLQIGVDDLKVEWEERLIEQLAGLLSRVKLAPPTSSKAPPHSPLFIEATIRNLSAVALVHKTSFVCLHTSQLILTRAATLTERSTTMTLMECRIVSGVAEGERSEGFSMEDILAVSPMAMSYWDGQDGESRCWNEAEVQKRQTQRRKILFEARKLALHGAATRVQISVSNSRLLLQFPGSLFLAWSPTVHKLIRHLVSVTKLHFLRVFSDLSTSSTPSPLALALLADDSVQVDLELPNHHLMSWRVPVLQVELSPLREATIISPSLSTFMDGALILSATDIRISRLLRDVMQDKCRAVFTGLQTSSNKLWSWTAEKMLFQLPFQFDFAQVFDEFITAIKWMREVGGKKPGRPIDPFLAADLHVAIQEAILEMEDDPFERALQTNHELGEDEVFECERRRQMLAQRIMQLTKRLPLLSKTKMDELYQSLLERNGAIYMSRRTQLGDSQTPLLRSEWQRFELRAFADESMRTDASCLQLMAALDPLATLPHGMEFSTLWGRQMQLDLSGWLVSFKDYPQPYLDARDVHLFGQLVAAERLSHSGRSLRECRVPLPPPWTAATVLRNIAPLKFFFDLQCESEDLRTNYGPCWEPCLTMISLCWNNISSPSRDPSPLLPFWDKMRLLFHGRFLWLGRRVVTNILASLDPFNTSERVEMCWGEMGLEWQDGEIRIRSGLDVFLRTASPYDDSRVLELPHLRLRIQLKWNSAGSPSDHHSVLLCAPHKLPHSATDHDSYRSFRSSSLSVVLSLTVQSEGGRPPHVLLYANTLRCIEQLVKTITMTNRNVKRGRRFGVVGSPKKQLSKHFRNVHISVDFPKFVISYWMSHSSPTGLRLTCERMELLSSLLQSVSPPVNSDGIRRRKVYQWCMEHISVTFGGTQVHVFGEERGVGGATSDESPPLLSFSRLVHTSEPSGVDRSRGGAAADWPTKKLAVHGLRACWTAEQRDACLLMAEGARRAQLLRSVLALHATTLQPGYEEKQKKQTGHHSREALAREKEKATAEDDQHPHADTLLDRLIMEADTKKIAHCEQGTALPSASLQGVTQATANDVIEHRWHVELLNSQLMLCGERNNFVILTASRATLSQKIHRGVWRKAQLLGKKTWSAHVSGMQYFAPTPQTPASMRDARWLPREVIEEKSFSADSCSPVDAVQMMLGESGDAVGGFVHTMKPANGEALQLQRIVSRCSCQMYWCSFSEEIDNPDVQAVPAEESDEMAEELGVDCLTLKHNMLEASSSSAQYEMVVDVVNKLVLFVDPRMKAAAEKRSRRAFECRQLSMAEMINNIENQQAELREIVCVVRSLERQLFHVESSRGNGEGEETTRRCEALLAEMDESKAKQLDLAEHLAITISVYKQRCVENLLAKSVRVEGDGEGAAVVRKFEVCFEECTWKLAEADGQIGIAQLHIRSFLYTRTMRVENSGEHLFEIGSIRMSNLQSETHKDTIHRDERYPSNSPAVRVICRHLAPVGGIDVKEHFEVNIAPMVAQLTYSFFKVMMGFFFPGRGVEDQSSADFDDEQRLSDRDKQPRLSLSRRLAGGLAVVRAGEKKAAAPPAAPVDDIDKMRIRAHSNNFFVYIKITEVPFIVSYKGLKEKNIEDIKQLTLVFPECEIHDRNCTWLDLALYFKNVCRKELVQQFMKQKLLRNRLKGNDVEHPTTEEDKKRIAIGSTTTLTEKQRR